MHQPGRDMQWILQDFEDTAKLAVALDRLGLPYSWHKIVPFLGDLVPEPQIADPRSVVLFGAYSMWRYAQAHNLRPGVFKLRPFLHEVAWHPHLLNGPGALVLSLADLPDRLPDDGALWFLRPVDDSKELAGTVKSSAEILHIARQVLALPDADLPRGSLRPDTLLMLCRPVAIQKEWRVWIVQDRIVTASLYKEGRRVVYREEIDTDARAFAESMVRLNPGYAPAYVMDICRTGGGLCLLETNCINAAGFYAANLMSLASAIDALGPA
jgi:hypothetical protein